MPILLAFSGLFVYPLLRFLLLPLVPALGPALGPLGSVGVAVQESGLSVRAILDTLQLGLITAASPFRPAFFSPSCWNAAPGPATACSPQRCG